MRFAGPRSAKFGTRREHGDGASSPRRVTPAIARSGSVAPARAAATERTLERGKPRFASGLSCLRGVDRAYGADRALRNASTQPILEHRAREPYVAADPEARHRPRAHGVIDPTRLDGEQLRCLGRREKPRVETRDVVISSRAHWAAPDALRPPPGLI
jgi:hypothetical protein